MRRFQALLIAAGLAAMPAYAAAGPSKSYDSTPQVSETLDVAPRHCRLGVLVMGLTPELRTHLGAVDDRGVLVARVEPGTPAAAAEPAWSNLPVWLRDFIKPLWFRDHS